MRRAPVPTAASSAPAAATPYLKESWAIALEGLDDVQEVYTSAVLSEA